jgi:N-acetylglucosamine-6-phosphate deacetylase
MRWQEGKPFLPSFNKSMKTIILSRQIYTPHQFLDNTAIQIQDGKILALIASDQVKLFPDFEIIHAEKLTITPGLIDVHTHGAMDADAMDATLESLNIMSRFYAEHGITAFYPTTMAAGKTETYKALENVVQNKDKVTASQILGVHLEGPYLCQEFKGAQPSNALRLADKGEYAKWFASGLASLITVAPELEGSQELIQYGIKCGTEFAIGHSAASYEEVIHAADLGVRQATHTFNGMKGLNHREPGTVGGILSDDRIFAQVIVDGVHIHPAVVKVIIRAKGFNRTILITDSMRATGMKDRDYDLGSLVIRVTNGVSRTLSGGLAGSTLTLDQAVRNVMNFAQISFQDAIRMATYSPAEAMHIQNRKGQIKPGMDADLTFFDEKFHVSATMLKGKFVFGKIK